MSFIEQGIQGIKEETTSKEAIDLKVSKDSGFSIFFLVLGILTFGAGLLCMVGCAEASNYSGKKDQYGITAASCFIVSFNLFFASHIITILANARWSLNQIALNTAHTESGTSLISGVVQDLQKISEHGKEQPEELKKKSIQRKPLTSSNIPEKTDSSKNVSDFDSGAPPLV
tara:strand:+ start:259 stop:774 length:516 start_codon:yes stop_codon:yes gene_type:complete